MAHWLPAFSSVMKGSSDAQWLPTSNCFCFKLSSQREQLHSQNVQGFDLVWLRTWDGRLVFVFAVVAIQSGRVPSWVQTTC